MDKNVIDKSYKLWIDGKWVEAEGGKMYDTVSPATGEVLATCADASRKDVDTAVKAGWKAFSEWKKTSVAERSIFY